MIELKLIEIFIDHTNFEGFDFPCNLQLFIWPIKLKLTIGKSKTTTVVVYSNNLAHLKKL